MRRIFRDSSGGSPTRGSCSMGRASVQVSLDAPQLLNTLAATEGERPPVLCSKPWKVEGDVVGHIELTKVNYDTGTARLGRVLIGDPNGEAVGWGARWLRTPYPMLSIGLVLT